MQAVTRKYKIKIICTTQKLKGTDIFISGSSGVNIVVVFQSMQLTERLRTHLALVWFFTGVDAHVGVQVRFVAERFPAARALIRFFTWTFAEVRRDKMRMEMRGLDEPVCERTWSAKWADWEKLFGHMSHLKGFSPVCVLMCTFSVLFDAKFLPQYSHLNNFSTVFFWEAGFFFVFALIFAVFDVSFSIAREKLFECIYNC